MILKFCMQYVSKFEKFSSSQQTRKGQFSFQFQRSEVAKIVQTTIQLRLFHRLASLCSKSFRLGFSSTWTENFQRYELGLEKAEEAETKLPMFAESEKAREFLKNIYFCFIDYIKPLSVWITTNCGKFLKRWEYQTTLPVSCETCMWVKKQQLELDM